MTSWELIFLQSRVNHGAHDGDHLPAQNWDWPRGTWFQERLYYLRAGRRQIAQRSSFKMKSANGPTVSPVSPGQESTTMANQGQIPGHFSVAPLLLVEQENSAEVRQALLEERRCEMNLTLTMLLIAFTALSACVSPEATRTRGGGPGADLGNRTEVLEMHEGSLPFWETPQIITTKHAPIETADQAYALSRR
jgi:hypothetical protein